MNTTGIRIPRLHRSIIALIVSFHLKIFYCTVLDLVNPVPYLCYLIMFYDYFYDYLYYFILYLNVIISKCFIYFVCAFFVTYIKTLCYVMLCYFTIKTEAA